MVRFNMRSLAFMAFAVFAAASPVAESMNRQVAPAAVAAPVANVAHAQVAHAQFGQIEREAIQPAPVAAQQAQDMMAPQKGHSQDPSQMVRMVPCSESECFNSLTPEEQVSFRRQCEQMKLEQMKNNAKGQNRVAKALPPLTFYKMVPAQQAGANGVAANGNSAVDIRPQPTFDTKLMLDRNADLHVNGQQRNHEPQTFQVPISQPCALQPVLMLNPYDQTETPISNPEQQRRLGILSRANSQDDIALTEIAADPGCTSLQPSQDLSDTRACELSIVPNLEADSYTTNSLDMDAALTHLPAATLDPTADQRRKARPNITRNVPTNQRNTTSQRQCHKKHMQEWDGMPKIVYHQGVNGTHGYWGPEGMYPFDNVVMRFGEKDEYQAYGTMFINDTVVNGLHPYVFIGNDTLIDGWMVIGNDTTALNNVYADRICVAAAVVLAVVAAAHAAAAVAIAVIVATVAAATAAAVNVATAVAIAAVASHVAAVANHAAANRAAASAATAQCCGGEGGGEGGGEEGGGEGHEEGHEEGGSEGGEHGEHGEGPGENGGPVGPEGDGRFGPPPPPPPPPPQPPFLPHQPQAPEAPAPPHPPSPPSCPIPPVEPTPPVCPTISGLDEMIKAAKPTYTIARPPPTLPVNPQPVAARKGCLPQNHIAIYNINGLSRGVAPGVPHYSAKVIQPAIYSQGQRRSTVVVTRSNAVYSGLRTQNRVAAPALQRTVVAMQAPGRVARPGGALAAAQVQRLQAVPAVSLRVGNGLGSAQQVKKV
ncbi:hypothetical protein EV178_002163 [Coemansia sp. RSA 1646]|nr:hypothetical protein EV178_002163 [Coemansia sp. RSA 1646]